MHRDDFSALLLDENAPTEWYLTQVSKDSGSYSSASLDKPLVGSLLWYIGPLMRLIWVLNFAHG